MRCLFPTRFFSIHGIEQQLCIDTSHHWPGVEVTQNFRIVSLVPVIIIGGENKNCQSGRYYI